MRNLNQTVFAFAAGLCLTLFVVFTLGASQPSTDKDDMSIDVVPVLGGMGGILMTVTNHTENKAYMYVMESDKDKDKGEGNNQSLPTLVGTIDLSSAGNEKLTAEMKEKESK